MEDSTSIARTGADIIVLKFADSAIPVFKEKRNRDYIEYGDKNNYPEYLSYLFNKSAKHNAIITGKANYIFGEGFENGDTSINRLQETINDVAKKCILDIELYGGFYMEIVWDVFGKVKELYHVDYQSIRLGKECGFFFKQSWDIHNREQEEFIPGFNPADPTGTQIYAYHEYRPGVRFYPLPGYIGCNNYIETDIEISKYYLSAIRNGMMPSKMIQFFKGNPTDEEKKEIERRMQKKFSGSENAGRFFLVFNDSNDSKSVQVDDMSATELDKHFVELNKTCQQEIFSGHNVTSPMLFGIKTEGQLGGSGELATAYSIFQNTYAKPKASAVSKEFQYLLGFSLKPGRYELRPTDPVGIQFDIKDVVNSLPKAFVFDKLGIPQELWDKETIGTDNKATPTIPVAPSTQIGAPLSTADAAMSNDAIRSLTAKQHQQVMRIIRDYSKGRMTELAAKALLRTGYGLSDADINDLLGIVPEAMSFAAQEDEVIGMFDQCGDSKYDFEIVRSKKVSFSSHLEAEDDENVYIHEAFKTYDVSRTEDRILQLIKKDPKITPKVIAEAIGETEAYVNAKIANLTKRGYIEATTSTIGEDEVIERLVPDLKGLTTQPPTEKHPPVEIFIKYSYEGPQDSHNRPFCAKLMALNRVYSRAEIEKISERLGYSVFDRRGGFWRHSDGTITPYCRHSWRSNIVVKKK